MNGYTTATNHRDGAIPMEEMHHDRAYRAALDFLYGRINYERLSAAQTPRGAFRLERMRQLLRELGDPQNHAPVIHVAGTKGKGSTAALIAAVLSAAGYKTGLYTSPHLERLEERIKIDQIDCTAEELVELCDQIRPVVENMDRRAGGERTATFFEITTALAWLQFARRDVDAAVVEVGLGGRFDSTNVCRPQACAITSISFDHTRQLGNTLPAIAAEKAGIIKRGVPVVSGVIEPSAAEVIRQTARQRGSRLLELAREFDFEYLPNANRNWQGDDPIACSTIDYLQKHNHGQSQRLPGLELGLLGRHQGANAAVALAVLGLLGEAGWRLPVSALRTGLRQARCPARVEVVSKRPTVVVDTAHNVASIDALLEVLDESFSARRRILLFATSEEKDAAGMLRRLLPGFDCVYLTRYQNNPRGVDPYHLFELAEQILAAGEQTKRTEVVVQPKIDDAWRQAAAGADAADLLCATGSFFLAAEIRPLATGHPNGDRLVDPQSTAPRAAIP